MKADMVLLSCIQQLDALLKLRTCVIWNDSEAGGISSCLYPNCDQKTENGATTANGDETVMWKRSIWLLHHWAEGALSKMNAEVLATKLTLTCQISSASKEGETGRRSKAAVEAFLFSFLFFSTSTS